MVIQSRSPSWFLLFIQKAQSGLGPLCQSTADCEPAIIHRIETTPAPLQQVRTVPRFSYVLIAVKLTKENTVPNTKQWATWLKTNLPHYIGEIDITAKWKTGSAVVMMVLPIEIWLDLPPRSGYSFVDFHRAWDAQAARQNLENAVAPQQPQLQEQRAPVMRSGNLQMPSGSSSAGGK